METKLKKSNVKAKSSLIYGPLSNLQMIYCTISNTSRGIAILWNDVLQIDLLQSYKMIIDMYITTSNLNMSRSTTGIYGYPYASQKHLTCDTINDISHRRISSK